MGNDLSKDRIERPPRINRMWPPIHEDEPTPVDLDATNDQTPCVRVVSNLGRPIAQRYLRVVFCLVDFVNMDASEAGKSEQVSARRERTAGDEIACSARAEHPVRMPVAESMHKDGSAWECRI